MRRRDLGSLHLLLRTSDLLVLVFEKHAELLQHRLIRSRESADKCLRIQLGVVNVLTRIIVHMIALVVTTIAGRPKARRFIDRWSGRTAPPK